MCYLAQGAVYWVLNLSTFLKILLLNRQLEQLKPWPCKQPIKAQAERNISKNEWRMKGPYLLCPDHFASSVSKTSHQNELEILSNCLPFLVCGTNQGWCGICPGSMIDLHLCKRYTQCKLLELSIILLQQQRQPTAKCNVFLLLNDTWLSFWQGKNW